MSDQQPATNADLTQAIEGLEASLTTATGDLETRLTAAMRDMEARLTAAFTAAMADTEHRLQSYAGQAAEDAETRIIRAFMGIAETQASRSRDLENSRERMLERLAATEGRLLELERRFYGKTS
jgi:hypothetical protein